MCAATTRQTEIDKQMELLRMKHRIKDLELCEGNGTSMISLFIPPGNAQLVRANKMVTEELGTATNIKSRV